MSYYADLIDKLAVDVMKAAEEIGDERLPETIAQSIGASSPTTEELFRTAVRIRSAEARARNMLDRCRPELTRQQIRNKVSLTCGFFRTRQIRIGRTSY
jgi:hypothetical protein